MSNTNEQIIYILKNWRDTKVNIPTGLYHGPAYDPVPDRKFEEAAPAVFEDGRYFVSITDNVLDPEDWGLWRITIQNGAITINEVVNAGAYALPATSAADLLRAMCWDPTGDHPEVYTEVYKDPQTE